MNITSRLPEINHYGQRIPEGSIFFKIPQNIREIFSNSTPYFDGQKPLTRKEGNFKYFKNISFALVLSSIIILIVRVINPIWLSNWIGISTITAIFISNSSTKFKGVCNYVGTNGFAEYSFLNLPYNIVSSSEIPFNNVTDLLKVSESKKVITAMKKRTTFLWLNDG